MQFFNLSESNSIVNECLYELRDIDLQKNTFLVRENIKQLGSILAYESSKYIDYVDKKIETPFCKATIKSIEMYPVIYTILRAGIPFMEGICKIYKNSEVAFFAGSHLHSKPEVDFFSSSSIENKELIIADPMMTTGATVEKALETIISNGVPKKIILLSVIITNYALNKFTTILPTNSIIITCCVDDFNPNIKGTRPGIGDIGDLLYGNKKNKISRSIK